MSAEPVRPEVLKQMLDSKIRYFVVDCADGDDASAHGSLVHARRAGRWR